MNYEITEPVINRLEKQITALEVIHMPKLAVVKTLKDARAFDPAELLTKLCAAVAIAMPILQLVSKLPFVGKKAKAAIKRIREYAAMACPTE